MHLWLWVLLILVPVPVFAQETVRLDVNQTSTLQWTWAPEDGTGPLRGFVFRCHDFRKDVTADVRQLTFRELVDVPGTYAGCTLAAQNEAGLSAPVAIPDFTYAYSYSTLGRLLVECVVSLGAIAGVVGLYRRRLASALAHTSPVALPPPVIILHQEATHVSRHS